jgi:hypothetical protein
MIPQTAINIALSIGLVLSAMSHIRTDRRLSRLERNKPGE